MPVGGERLGDEDPHAGTRCGGRLVRRGVVRAEAARAASWAAATAAPGSTGRPTRREASSRTAIAPRISSSSTEPRWPSRKILPLSLPWPPASTTPRRLTSPLKAFQSRPVGDQGGGDRLRGEGRIGEELEAERGQPGPRRGGAGLVAGEDALWRLVLHQPEALVDLVDDRDGRRPRRLARRRALAVRGAGRGRSAASGPSPSPSRRASRGGDHGQARGGHPGLLRAGDDDVDAPGVHLERDGAEAADRCRRGSARRAPPRGSPPPARAIGFVTPVEVSLWVSRTACTPGSSTSAARTSAGVAAWPHSTSSGARRRRRPRRSWRTGRRRSRSTRRGRGRRGTGR